MMTCLDLNRVLAEQPLDALPPAERAQVDQHLAGCAECRGLADSIDGIKRMTVPEALFNPKVIDPVRPMPSRAWFLSVAFVVPVAVALIGVVYKGAYGLAALPTESLVLYTALGVVALVALTLGFFRQFKPGAREAIDGRAVTVMVFVAFVAFASVEFGWHPKPGFALVQAWRCFSFGLTVTLGAAIALLVWARTGFAANPGSAAFWTGALASIAGMIALTVHCPNLELSHLLLGHASVILLGASMTALAGRALFGLK